MHTCVFAVLTALQSLECQIWHASLVAEIQEVSEQLQIVTTIPDHTGDFDYAPPPPHTHTGE